MAKQNVSQDIPSWKPELSALGKTGDGQQSLIHAVHDITGGRSHAAFQPAVADASLFGGPKGFPLAEHLMPQTVRPSEASRSDSLNRTTNEQATTGAANGAPGDTRAGANQHGDGHRAADTRSNNNFHQSRAEWDEAQHREVEGQRGSEEKRAHNDKELNEGLKKAGFKNFQELSDFVVALGKRNDRQFGMTEDRKRQEEHKREVEDRQRHGFYEE